LGDDLVVQSATDVRLLDAADGAQRWRAPRHEGPLAAISATAVVFWEAGGELAALARNNGALLWRLRFQLPRPGRP
jgi:outer membrane protein assembly factor BamB